MPYKLSTRMRGGKKMFCATSLDSNKTYCSKSAGARKKLIKMHEIFKNTPKSKIRIAKKKK